MSSYDKDLVEWFSDMIKAVIIGIGNPLRLDDGVGLDIVKKLNRKTSKDEVLLIESEGVPEDYLEPIVEFKPSHILIVDAALLGLNAGSVRMTESSGVPEVAISTHMLPIQIFCNYLRKVTKAKVGLLLIQPENVDFGEGLSPKLKKTVNKVTEVLLRILS